MISDDVVFSPIYVLIHVDPCRWISHQYVPREHAWPQAPTIRTFLGAMACYLRRGATVKGRAGLWVNMFGIDAVSWRPDAVLSCMTHSPNLRERERVWGTWGGRVGLLPTFFPENHRWILVDCFLSIPSHDFKEICAGADAPSSHGAMDAQDIAGDRALARISSDRTIAAKALPWCQRGTNCNRSSPFQRFPSTSYSCKAWRDFRKGLWHFWTSFETFDYCIYTFLDLLISGSYTLTCERTERLSCDTIGSLHTHLMQWPQRNWRTGSLILVPPHTWMFTKTSHWCGQGVKLGKTCCSHMPYAKCIETKSKFRSYQRHPTTMVL